jgi:hypothetical protein
MLQTIHNTNCLCGVVDKNKGRDFTRGAAVFHLVLQPCDGLGDHLGSPLGTTRTCVRILLRLDELLRAAKCFQTIAGEVEAFQNAVTGGRDVDPGFGRNAGKTDAADGPLTWDPAGPSTNCRGVKGDDSVCDVGVWMELSSLDP